MPTRNLLRVAGVVRVMALAVSSSVGYIHFPPETMRKMCKQSTNIRVLAVKKYDKERGIVVYRVAETLKGQNPNGDFSIYARTTSVWVKQQGRWRLVAAQLSDIPQQQSQ